MADLDALTAAAFTGDTGAVAALSDWLAERLPAVGEPARRTADDRLIVMAAATPGMMWVCVVPPPGRRWHPRTRSTLIARADFAREFQGWFLGLVGVSETA